MRHLDIVDAARMFAAVDMSVADAESPCGAPSTSTASGGRSPRSPWPTPTATRTPPPIPAGCRCSLHPPTRSTPAGTTRSTDRVPGLQNLFQTRHLHLTLISTTAPGTVRHYDSGRALRQDVVNARVWLGSTSAPPTSHPGTWPGSSPPGRLTTTSSPPTTTDTQKRGPALRPSAPGGPGHVPRRARSTCSPAGTVMDRYRSRPSSLTSRRAPRRADPRGPGPRGRGRRQVREGVARAVEPGHHQPRKGGPEGSPRVTALPVTASGPAAAAMDWVSPRPLNRSALPRDVLPF